MWAARENCRSSPQCHGSQQAESSSSRAPAAPPRSRARTQGHKTCSGRDTSFSLHVQPCSCKGIFAAFWTLLCFNKNSWNFRESRQAVFVLRSPHTALSIQVWGEQSWHILHCWDFNDAQSFHFLLYSDNGKHGLLMYNIKPNKVSSCSFPGVSCCLYQRYSNVKFPWKGSGSTLQFHHTEISRVSLPSALCLSLYIKYTRGSFISQWPKPRR